MTSAPDRELQQWLRRLANGIRATDKSEAIRDYVARMMLSLWFGAESSSVPSPMSVNRALTETDPVETLGDGSACRDCRRKVCCSRSKTGVIWPRVVSHDRRLGRAVNESRSPDAPGDPVPAGAFWCRGRCVRAVDTGVALRVRSHRPRSRPSAWGCLGLTTFALMLLVGLQLDDRES